jgi:hypothetical protein
MSRPGEWWVGWPEGLRFERDAFADVSRAADL